MFYYEITVDAYNSRDYRARGARVVTYSKGYDENDALDVWARTGVIIASDGTVSDGLTPWPGTNNLPEGDIQSRSLPEWRIVAIEEVDKPGKAKIVWETMSSAEYHHYLKYEQN